jgi:hypothetical protein
LIRRWKLIKDWKIKISMLWIIASLAYVAHPIMVLSEPTTLAGIIAGRIDDAQITQALLLVFAILILVPLVMAFLSLILKDSINRWANAIVGVFYAMTYIKTVVNSFTLPSYSGALLTFVAFVASVLIVWYAWKSKPT